MMEAIPKRLTRGWRQSLRTGVWYRQRRGWVAIVRPIDGGHLVVLKRTSPTFEDALADANLAIGQVERGGCRVINQARIIVVA